MTKSNKFISAIIMIVIGALLIFLKGAIIGYLLTALGVALIVMGILDAVQKKDIPACVIKCVIGALIIVGGWVFVAVILYILGALLVVVGVEKNIRPNVVAHLILNHRGICAGVDVLLYLPL